MSDEPYRSTEIDDLLASFAAEDAAEAEAAAATAGADVEVVDDPAPPVTATRKKKHGNAFVEWLIVVVVAVSAAMLVKTYVVQQFAVAGESMYSTLHDSDRVLVNKLSYRLHDPNRGDVVVLKTLEGAGERDLIKRVIGLPGEVIDISGCHVYIDGKELIEPYLDPEVVACTDTEGYSFPFTVPDDSVFVLGDNRGASKDSRALGPIPYGDLLGRAFVIIWPSSDWQWL